MQQREAPVSDEINYISLLILSEKIFFNWFFVFSCELEIHSWEQEIHFFVSVRSTEIIPKCRKGNVSTGHVKIKTGFQQALVVSLWTASHGCCSVAFYSMKRRSSGICMLLVVHCQEEALYSRAWNKPKLNFFKKSRIKKNIMALLSSKLSCIDS